MLFYFIYFIFEVCSNIEIKILMFTYFFLISVFCFFQCCVSLFLEVPKKKKKKKRKKIKIISFKVYLPILCRHI